jgi:branched-chain amino acid transport system ATP-binding protein
MNTLECHGLSKSFGGVHAVRDLRLSVSEGETLGIIGPNGAGKTTLFNLLAGSVRPDSGTVVFRGEDVSRYGPERRARIGMIRSFQNGRTFANMSAEENVILGAHASRTAVRSGAALAVLELLQALLPFGIFGKEERRLHAEATALLELFGERLAPRSSESAFSFSYANRRRIEIARALAAHPLLLLLDEPTAGMNPTETIEILEFLKGLKSQGLTMIVIEHKLPLIMRISDRIVVMDEGAAIADGRPEDVVRDAQVIEAYLGKVHSHRDSSKKEGVNVDGNADVEVY